MAFWDMLGNTLMYFFYGIGILILLAIIFKVFELILKTGDGIVDYIKYILSGGPSIKKEALFVAFKKHKMAKKNIDNFWKDLQKEEPDLYNIFSKDYNYCNKLLQERDKKYPKKTLIKTGGYDKKRDMHRSGTKEIEIRDD